MIEVISNFLSFIAGVLVTAIMLAWRHREQIQIIVDWFLQAYKDGKITKQELGELLIRLGKSLKDVGVE